MNIIQLTPGAGAMYCGNCLRDNALVAELRHRGHNALMLPLYLPITLDEKDESAGNPVFFGGINVYLHQKSRLFRHAPGFLRNLLTSPALLKWASGKTAKTRAEDLGQITLSMLRGEQGKQASELEILIDWLKRQPPPDVVCLSNALLVGMARRLRSELKVPVVCTLQGEDAFLDSLPSSHRAECWQTLSERAAEIDAFIAPSHYFGELMGRRLSLPPSRVHVVYNGINLDGFVPTTATANGAPPVLGFFARMCKEKGLHTLVEAFIKLHGRKSIPGLQLHVGGSCGPADEPLVNELKSALDRAGILPLTRFFPNVTKAEKQRFLQRLTVFSVPAQYGEAFGLYLVEALASSVPVVQPDIAAFPEIVRLTGGGVLCEPTSDSLANRIEEILKTPGCAEALGMAGRQAVEKHFTRAAMAEAVLEVLNRVTRRA